MHKFDAPTAFAWIKEGLFLGAFPPTNSARVYLVDTVLPALGVGLIGWIVHNVRSELGAGVRLLPLHILGRLHCWNFYHQGINSDKNPFTSSEERDELMTIISAP